MCVCVYVLAWTLLGYTAGLMCICVFVYVLAWLLKYVLLLVARLCCVFVYMHMCICVCVYVLAWFLVQSFSLFVIVGCAFVLCMCISVYVYMCMCVCAGVVACVQSFFLCSRTAFGLGFAIS